MNEPTGIQGCACCSGIAPTAEMTSRASSPADVPGLGEKTRLQLALNVPDLAAAVDFYSKVLGVEVHKERPGYANFEVAEPPLKLVLFEAPNAVSGLNHLGVEGFDDEFVATARSRLHHADLTREEEHQEVCCHAEQNKVLTYSPDGVMFEFYRITDDDPRPESARI